MGKFLDFFPKNVLAFLLISGGIAFIILASPPHSVCQSQVEVVSKSQQKFLFKNPKSKQVTTTKYETLRDHCKKTNNPGGCYELFQELKILMHDLGTLPAECASAIADVKEYKRAIWESVEILVRLAWGDQPPASYNAKFGWLEAPDLSLFCQLTARINILYGDLAWQNFRERMMKDMPGSKDLTRNQIWDLSIFSENCNRYP